MKRRCKAIVALMLACCMLFGSIPAVAADELLGTVVDGSLLTDDTEVTYTTPQARGTYLASGSGGLSLSAYRKLYMYGDTTSYQSVDKIKVTLYLQRLVNGSWVTVYTLGPKTAYNTYYVGNSNTYSVAGGYYYRVYGGHTVIEGSKSEAHTSYSDGFWVE